MKTNKASIFLDVLKSGISAVTFAASLFLSSEAARSQTYSIDWFAVAGGGGTSTGALYRVTGTIGQPETSRLTGAHYTLDGGFWSMFAVVQTPGSPVLRMFRNATNAIVVAWPAPSTGFTLQQTPDLAHPKWTEVTNLVLTINGERQVIISKPSGNCFYRLKY